MGALFSEENEENEENFNIFMEALFHNVSLACIDISGSDFDFDMQIKFQEKWDQNMERNIKFIS